MTDPDQFRALEAENARLRAALTDCNTSLNTFGRKLAVCAHLLAFSPDESAEEIRDKVRLKLRSK